MTQTAVRAGTRCQEHPHRPADQKCDRCAQGFCVECLSPTDRLSDGTRKWYCPKCVWLVQEETAREARERALGYKLERAARRGRIALISGISAATLIGVSTAGYFLFARSFGTAAGEQTIAERAGTCGELTRIRSIGSIGTQGPEDAVNVFAYPQRADARLLGDALPAATALTEPVSLVDECNTGWRAGGAPESVQLPVSLVVDTKRDGIFVQRIALWQDAAAPRTAWVRDFELLSSSTDSGDDFLVVPLDREAQLKESAEAQWFEITRPGPGSAQQKFPEAIPLRRLQVRVLNTWGAPRQRARVDQVALGEVAAYGPDLEVVIGDTDDGNFSLKPNSIRALGSQPKFVMFMNQSKVATHRFVSVAQERNFDVTIEPGQVKSIQFTAGRPGRYEFVCKIPGHEFKGLVGSIQVR